MVYCNTLSPYRQNEQQDEVCSEGERTLCCRRGREMARFSGSCRAEGDAACLALHEQRCTIRHSSETPEHDVRAPMTINAGGETEIASRALIDKGTFTDNEIACPDMTVIMDGGLCVRHDCDRPISTHLGYL